MNLTKFTEHSVENGQVYKCRPYLVHCLGDYADDDKVDGMYKEY
jgi:hypothetical protein